MAKKMAWPKKQKLKQYLAEPLNGQEELARRLGITQSAISKMITRERDITVIEHRDGYIELWEEKLVASSMVAEHCEAAN